LYAFCKSWHSSSDWRLLVVAVLLFIVGVASFSEKPFALNRAKIKTLAAVSAWVQGQRKPSKWTERIHHFFMFEESSCFSLSAPAPAPAPGGEDEASRNHSLLQRWCGKKDGRSQRRKPVALTEADKVLMVLSDMSLLAAANEMVARGRAISVGDILPPLTVAEKVLPRWLRNAFAFIYTRATVVVTPLYLLYHLLLVPILHIAALTLFASSDKHPYKRADVKITYIILCLTAALDVFALFIRQLLYRLMSMTGVPALCETVPSFNVIDAAIWEADKSIGWVYKCASRMGINCYCFSRPQHDDELYAKVAQTVITDLVDARDRDLASYRTFQETNTNGNWALSKELQEICGVEIKKSLCSVSFDRSVLLWHIATDLCRRCTDDAASVDDRGQEQKEEEEVGVATEELEGAEGGTGAEQHQEHHRGVRDPALRLHKECTIAISNYMAHLLNVNPDMLLTGSRHHLISEAVKELQTYSFLFKKKRKFKLSPREIDLIVAREQYKSADGDASLAFHTKEACKLAKELLQLDDDTRWMLMYRVWLGMLCYSASMCRGYLHAKSLGNGGEFLSFVWLMLVLKGGKSLADKLQMPSET
jgi:hypothetical protein